MYMSGGSSSHTQMAVARRHVQASRLALILCACKNLCDRNLLPLGKLSERGGQVILLTRAGEIDEIVNLLLVQLGGHVDGDDSRAIDIFVWDK